MREMHVTKDLGLSYSTELRHVKEGGLVLPLRWGSGRVEKEGNKNRSNEQIFKKVLPDMKLVQYVSPVHLG